MPHFYFDIHDGERRSHDEDGIEMADFETARLQAIEVIPDLMREKLKGDESRSFTVTIRDEEGVDLFRSSVLFQAEYLNAAALDVLKTHLYQRQRS